MHCICIHKRIFCTATMQWFQPPCFCLTSMFHDLQTIGVNYNWSIYCMRDICIIIKLKLYDTKEDSLRKVTSSLSLQSFKILVTLPSFVAEEVSSYEGIWAIATTCLFFIFFDLSIHYCIIPHSKFLSHCTFF